MCMQSVLAFAMVWGLSFFSPKITVEVSLYLAGGATTIVMIAFGCVLAAQMGKHDETNRDDGFSKDMAGTTSQSPLH